jgi:hypothetical protein
MASSQLVLMPIQVDSAAAVEEYAVVSKGGGSQTADQIIGRIFMPLSSKYWRWEIQSDHWTGSDPKKRLGQASSFEDAVDRLHEAWDSL